MKKLALSFIVIVLPLTCFSKNLTLLNELRQFLSNYAVKPAALKKNVPHRLTLNKPLAHPPKTMLSKKAMHLHVGMTKQQVFKLLGVPTWAETDKYVPLSWSWRNAQCNAIYVTFDKHMKVNSYDQGRAKCVEVVYRDVPDDQFLCTYSERQHALCMDV